MTSLGLFTSTEARRAEEKWLIDARSDGSSIIASRGYVDSVNDVGC